MTKTEEKTLKSELVRWCETHNESITSFQKKMGYTYNTAWQLLRGNRPVTPSVVGRFALVYGGAAVEEWIRMAGYAGKSRIVSLEVGELPAPNGATVRIPTVEQTLTRKGN